MMKSNACRVGNYFLLRIRHGSYVIVSTIAKLWQQRNADNVKVHSEQQRKV